MGTVVAWHHILESMKYLSGRSSVGGRGVGGSSVSGGSGLLQLWFHWVHGTIPLQLGH